MTDNETRVKIGEWVQYMGLNKSNKPFPVETIIEHEVVCRLSSTSDGNEELEQTTKYIKGYEND